MPALSLRCRVCETEHPLEAIGICSQLLRPARSRSTTGTCSRATSRASRSRRAAVALALRRPAAGRRRRTSRGSRPGLTPLVPAPRLAEELGIGELWLKLDTANPTHSFKDRVVAVAAAQGAGARARRRCPARRPATSPARSRRARRPRASTRPSSCPADLEPEKLAAAAVYGPTIYAVNGTYDHCSRLSVELVVRAALGLRQRQPALVLRRGLEDARLRDRRAARLGDAGRRRDPDRLGRALPQGRPGLRELQRLGLIDGGTPTLFGGQAAGCEPVATAFRDGTRSPRCGPTASRGRSRSATLPTATSPSRPPARRAARSTPCPRTRSGSTWRARRYDRRLRRDRDGRHARRAEGGGRGGRRRTDVRVVLLVTGDGLKTLGPVSHTYDPIMIEADADAFVDEVLVA